MAEQVSADPGVEEATLECSGNVLPVLVEYPESGSNEGSRLFNVLAASFQLLLGAIFCFGFSEVSD